MPHTLIAYSEAVDSAALTEIAGVSDAHVRVIGDQIIVPDWARSIAAVHAYGPFLTRGQLVSPTLRRVANLDISPVRTASAHSDFGKTHLLIDQPIPLESDEALYFYAAESGTGATRVTALVTLSDKAITPVIGAVHTLRATAAATLTAYTWTNAGLTFEQALAPGEYAIVGARAESAGLIGFRLVLTGYYHRPGGVGCRAATDPDPYHQRLGYMGEWGRFSHNTPPTVDFLSESADTSEVVYLDVLKVS